MQANVAPGSLESQLNAGASVLMTSPSAGPAVILVSGGVASTVNERDAGLGSVSGTELTAAT